MDQAISVVCICDTHKQAQQAICNLERAGIDMETLSTAIRDDSPESHDIEYYRDGDQTFFIPSIGPVLVGGPLASWIVTALENVAGGAGVSILGAALATLDLPRDSILRYEAALTSDRNLLVLHGLPCAIADAVKIIGGTTHWSHTVHGERVFDTVNRQTCW